MRARDILKGAALAAVLIGLAVAQGSTELTPNSPDPWLWLTDIHGAKPLTWVKQQNERTLAVLKSDPRGWLERGVWRTTWTNWRIMAGYLSRVDSLKELAKA